MLGIVPQPNLQYLWLSHEPDLSLFGQRMPEVRTSKGVLGYARPWQVHILNGTRLRNLYLANPHLSDHKIPALGIGFEYSQTRRLPRL